MAPDWSAQGSRMKSARLKAARAEAEGFSAESLTPEQRFERDYLIAGVIDRQLFWLDTAQFPYKNPAFYVDKLDPDPYLSREYAPLEKRMAGFIGYARSIPQLAADIRANLKMPMREDAAGARHRRLRRVMRRSTRTTCRKCSRP